MPKQNEQFFKVSFEVQSGKLGDVMAALRALGKDIKIVDKR